MLEVRRIRVPAEIAELLQVSTKEQVVVRRRLQFLDGEPVTLSSSYFPLWLAKGTRLESPEAIAEGPDGLIETLGHQFTHGIEIFRARMPTPAEARMLRLDKGIPVVRMLHVDYDSDNRTLQVADDVYSADRHEFAFEWTEPGTEERP